MITNRGLGVLTALAVFTAGFGPFKRSEEIAVERLTEAQQQLAAGQADAAVTTLRALRLEYQDTTAGYQGTALLGALLLEAGDLEGALAAALGVVQAPAAPADALRSAHLVAGLALHSQGKDADARLHLEPLKGTLPDAGDQARLAQAMVEITASAGDNLEEARWLLERHAQLPEGDLPPVEARLEALLTNTLASSQLEALSTEVGDRWPAELILYGQARAAFRQRDYAQVAVWVEAFNGRYPGHPLSANLALLAERAARSDAFEPTRIGVVLPLTGRFAAPGVAMRRGMELALKQAAGPAWADGAVELVFRDSKGDEAAAIEAVRALILEDRVGAILGPLTSSEAEGAARLAQELEVPMVALTQKPGIPEIGDFIFRDFPTQEGQLGALARYVHENAAVERVAILYPDTRFGAWAAETFWQACDEIGVAVTAVESYTPGQDDYTPVAKKLSGKFYPEIRGEELRHLRWQRANDNNPKNDDQPVELPPLVDFDAIFIPDQYKTAALLSTGLAYAEMPIGRFTVDKKTKPVFLLGGNTWNNPELARIGGDYVVGATFVTDFFPESTSPDTQAFVKAYKAAYGAAPDTFAAHGYDAVALLLGALGETRPASRQDLRDRIAQVDAFPGVTGPFSFDEVGELKKDPFVLTIDRRRRIVQVWPPVPTPEPAPKK